MKLLFKLDLDDPLEITLATARYKQFWEENQDKIIQSFHKHTGLAFLQKQITVKVLDQPSSRAGTHNRRMELSSHRKTESRVGGNLIHELAHRLVIGNGIDVDTDASVWKYHSHRHINLFLYDVWVDVLGKRAADQELKAERTNTFDYYRKAWDWALAKSYEERQNILARLIRNAVE